MKKLILFVLISSTIIMSGQECKPDKYKIIEINFKDKCIGKLPKKIKTGKFYKIKINNINPNIYSVLIGTKDTVLSRPELKMPSFGDFSLDALLSLTSSFKSNNDLKKAIGGNVDTTALKYKNEWSFNSDKNHKNKNNHNDNILKKQIDVFKEDLEKRVDTLEKTKEDFDKAKMEFYTYRLKMLKLELIDESYDFEKALKIFTEIRNSLILQQKSLNESLTQYESFIAKENVKTFLEKNKDYKETAGKIQTVFKTTNTKIDEFQELVSADIVEKLLKSILNFKNENTFESFPIQFRSEQTEVSIQFVPKDSTMGLQTEKIQPFNFPNKSTKYWSIGTSFYHAFNLVNDRFSSLTSIDANDKKQIQIIKEDPVKNEFGMAILLRNGGKINDIFGGHFSFGPGISIEKDSKPRLLLGGGISTGNKHALALDLGFVVGYVDKKSNSLNLTESYSEIPQTTLTKIDHGFFISLGYLYKF